MSIRHILTLTAATLLAAPTMQAQAPAAPAPVPPTGAPTTSTPVAPATPTTPTAAPAKPKPLSSQDSKGLIDLMESLQFHLRMSESAMWKKDEADLAEFGKKSHTELKTHYSPMVDYAQAHGVDNKKIPTEATKGDKADISKIGNQKGDKYKLAYFELYSKKGKQNVRAAETAIKAFTDPELKDIATKAAASINTYSEAAEAKYKELKGKK